MARTAPKPRAQRTTQTRHKTDAPREASHDAKPAVEPEKADAPPDLGHALFGLSPVVVVSIEQIRYVGRRVVPSERGRFSPRDVVDATSVRELCGVGRFKLKPLGANGRPCLPAIELDCPDESGGLDLVAAMPDEAGAPAQVAPSTGAAPSLDGVVNLFREQLRIQKETLDAELQRAEQRRQADMNSMGGFNAQLIELVKLGRSDEGGGKAQLEWLRETNTRVERENRELRSELLSLKEAHMKMRLGHETSGDAFVKAAVETYAPKVLELGAQLMAERRKGPAAAAGPAAGVELPDVKLPTAEELREQLAKGGQVPGEVLHVFRKLREAKALGDEVWSIVGPLISIATGSV